MKYAEYVNQAPIGGATHGAVYAAKDNEEASLASEMGATEAAVRNLINAVDQLGVVLLGSTEFGPTTASKPGEPVALISRMEDRLSSLRADANTARNVVENIARRIGQ
jgi:hypothetical protein